MGKLDIIAAAVVRVDDEPEQIREGLIDPVLAARYADLNAQKAAIDAEMKDLKKQIFGELDGAKVEVTMVKIGRKYFKVQRQTRNQSKFDEDQVATIILNKKSKKLREMTLVPTYKIDESGLEEAIGRGLVTSDELQPALEVKFVKALVVGEVDKDGKALKAKGKKGGK